MPKRAKELTIKEVEKKAKVEGRHAVGGVPGLHLLVAGEGRSWILRITIGDRRTDLGLGSYDDVSLGQAREEAGKVRAKVRDGLDPIAEERAERAAQAEAAKIAKIQAVTFKVCAEDVIDLKARELKNAKHLAQWRSTLVTYAYPTLGDKPVGSITEDDVEAVLQPIWTTKHETADRLRGRLENVFDYAKSKKYREGDNPAAWKGNLRERLGKVKVEQRHQPSLPHASIGTFMVELRKRDGAAARAMEFAILTATRSGEVRGATWAEIDLEAKMWIIPKGRMKREREHHVPLSDAAVALLKAQQAAKIKGVEYVFPAARGGMLSDMALSMLIRRINGERPKFVDRVTGEPVVPHGFRSTFRDWAGETTAYPREVIEHALAHSLADKAEAAYQRGSLLPKRVKLMDEWAKRCATADATAGNVVSINQAVA